MEGTDSNNRFECSLCLETFRDPRILSCFHTFCLKCLQTYISSVPNRDGRNAQFNCPLCRKVNILPPEGVQGLQKNFYLDEPDEIVRKKLPLCPDHPEEDLRFYCHVCKIPLCRDCKVIKHEGHKTEMLKDVVANRKEKLEKTLNDTEIAINESEIRLRTNIETDIDCLETVLSVMKESSAQMKNDIEETFSMVNSLIIPRLNSENDKMLTIQTKSDQKLRTVMDLKNSLAKAIDKNDNQSLFKLFSDLIEDRGELKRLRESPLVSIPGTSSATDMDIDLKRLSSFFFEFRDAVQDGLVKFKRNFETCRTSQDSDDVNMRVDERNKTPEVNLYNVEGNVKMKKKLKTTNLPSKTNLSSKKTQNLRGQLKYPSLGYDNRGNEWKSGTIVFTWGENCLRVDAEPDDPEKPDFIATLQPNSILDASVYLMEFRMHINTPSASWFFFRPDQPSDLQVLKCLAEEIKQFKAKSANVSSPRTATSMQDKDKAPNTPGSGVEGIVTLSSILIKPLKDLDKSLSNPGPSSESPSPPKRKAENTIFPSEKKPCLSANRSCVEDIFPVIPLNKDRLGHQTLRYHSTASATITCPEQTSSSSTDDGLAYSTLRCQSADSATITFPGRASGSVGHGLGSSTNRQLSTGSATITGLGQTSSSSTSFAGLRNSANTFTDDLGFSVTITDPIQSTSSSASADGQRQTTNKQMQPLLQDSDLHNACFQHEDQIPQVDHLGLDFDDSTSSQDKQDPKEERRQSVMSCIEFLVHACQCKDANCNLQSCHKMKRVVAHTKVCRKKANSGCQLCKQLIAICCYHVKHCSEDKCNVPFCLQIKHKLQQQGLQQRLQKAQLMTRSTTATISSRPGQSERSYPTAPTDPDVAQHASATTAGQADSGDSSQDSD